MTGIPDNESRSPHFLDLIRRSRRGKLKIHIGMSAGVGKTCRMPEEAHALLNSRVEVKIGFAGTHGSHNSKWYVLYVQTDKESAGSIPLARQRHLINHFKTAVEAGAEIIKVRHNRIAQAIAEQAEERQVTSVCVGKPHVGIWKFIIFTDLFRALLKKLGSSQIDLVILSS